MSEDQQSQANTTDTRAPSEADRCPKCNAGTLRPSKRKPKDWLKALIGLKPYRFFIPVPEVKGI